MTTRAKAPFELVMHHWEQLCQLSPTAEDFCQAWGRYLKDTGWDEDTFLNAFEQRYTEQSQ